MGEINNITAGKIPLVIGDKTYYLSQLTDKIRAEYERHLETEALKQIQLRKEQLGDDYLDLLTRTNQDIVSGVYSFGGSAFQASMKSIGGMINLFHLLLRPYQKSITLEQTKDLVMNHAVEISQGLNQALGQVTSAEVETDKPIKKKHKKKPTPTEGSTPPS
jgi:hypothetical protein